MNYTIIFMLCKSGAANPPASVRVSPRVLEPLALACGPHVDPGEDHGQLRRLKFDAVAIGGVGGCSRATAKDYADFFDLFALAFP